MSRARSSSILRGNLGSDLHTVPALDEIAQRRIHHALLLEDGLATECRRGDVDGVHAAAAARDVLDEQLRRGELLGKELCDGALGGGHGRELLVDCGGDGAEGAGGGERAREGS